VSPARADGAVGRAHLKIWVIRLAVVPTWSALLIRYAAAAPEQSSDRLQAYAAAAAVWVDIQIAASSVQMGRFGPTRAIAVSNVDGARLAGCVLRRASFPPFLDTRAMAQPFTRRAQFGVSLPSVHAYSIPKRSHSETRVLAINHAYYASLGAA